MACNGFSVISGQLVASSPAGMRARGEARPMFLLLRNEAHQFANTVKLRIPNIR